MRPWASWTAKAALGSSCGGTTTVTTATMPDGGSLPATGADLLLLAVPGLGTAGARFPCWLRMCVLGV